MASVWQTLDNVFTSVRTLTGKDTTTLTDAELLPIANKYFYLIFRELVGLNEDLYAEISAADLVSGQREYQLPVDDTTNSSNNAPYGGGIIKLQRVEISYDHTNWRVMKPVSLGEIRTPTILDSDLAKYYSTSAPVYYFADRSIWLAPVPGASDYTTAGNQSLRIYWVKRPSELDATSDIPDLPKDWLAVLQEGILYDIYRRFVRLTEAADAKQNYYASIQRLRELEQDIDVDQQPRLQTYKKRYD